MTNDDMDLVRAYAADRSEQAFETLVVRYINLVYSAAMRQVRDPHMAEEITQAVFVILARKAGTLGTNTILPSWLHRTAGYCAADALKTQRRRAQREQEAYMQSLSNETESETWMQIAPLLDAAVAGLNKKDQHAVMLRYFQNKSMKETGAALGASEEAAKKRVNRALEKLRTYFFRHGVTSTTATIAGAISANSVQAAPAALAKAATITALAKGATASTSTLTLIKGALKVMAWTKAKTVIVIGAGLLVATGVATRLAFQHQNSSKPQNIPRSSWKFAGYADPASALETLFWARTQGDGKMYLDSMTPELQQRLQQQFGNDLTRQGISLKAFFAQKSKESVSPVTALYIWGEETFSNQLLLRVWIPGKNVNGTFKMRKIGDQWKLDEEFLPDY